MSPNGEVLEAASSDSAATPGRSAKGASAGRRQADRLSASDWTAAAIRLLAEEGSSAVRIQRLCDELKVTKGSFYWHFASIGELLTAVAAAWGGITLAMVNELAAIDELPAAQRLERMTEHLLDENTAKIERSLRDLARTDESIRLVVADMDLKVLASVERALLDHGLPAEVARVRAGMLVYAGIGFAHGTSSLPQPTAQDVAAVIGLLTRLD